MIGKYRRRILFSLLFAVVVYAMLLLISDYQKLIAAVSDFSWQLTPVILGLTLFNYGLRFVKWHYYLDLVGAKGLPWPDSLLIFLSGFSMTVTPGKAGEWLKCFLVRQRTGTPVATTAPIILAERMTDGLAMLLLAAAGLLLFDNLPVRVFVTAVVIIAAVAIALVQNRPLARRVGGWMARLPFMEERVHHLRAFYNSSYELLRFKSLLFAVGLGFVSWSGECIALSLVLYGLGMPFSLTLVILSAFAMALATLAGSVLLMPGGLGIMEGSIDGLLLTFGRPPWLDATISPAVSAAATIIIRFATLWFAVAIGFVALLLFQHQYGGAEALRVEVGAERTA